MKHGSLISPDEATFGFGNAKAVFDAASVTRGDAADCITVPDAQLLFNGEFKRSGDDLKIVGDDGKSFLVSDYFKNDKRPTLLSPEGAALTGDVVSALAGPLAPGQYAQAGTPQSTGQAIGRVEKVEGNATVVRNGVTITLNTGDVIQKGDVAQTGAGGSLGIVFADGTAFNLAANARMVLNDFVYSAGGSNNSALISLVQGSISFVAGQVAKTGDMRVDTPVATMGIRGTAVLVEISANNGQTKFSVMVEPNGTTGSFNLYNKTTGALIATVNSSTIGWVVTPAGPLEVLAQQVQKTPAELARELQIMQQVFQTFNSGPFDPAGPQQTPTDPGRRGDVNPQGGPTGTTIIPSDNGPITVTTTQLTPPTTTVGNNTTNNTGNPSNGPAGQGPTGPGDGPAGPGDGPEPQTGDGFNHMYGTDQDDVGITELVGTIGNDFVHAGAGNDTIIAGHGGGNDIYDGGIGTDTIKFLSAWDPETEEGVTFQLNSFFEDGVWKSRAQSDSTGSDRFFNIEKIIASPGNDVFVLHNNVGDLYIDAGGGFDIVKLLDGVDVGDDGLEVDHFEMIDLTSVIEDGRPNNSIGNTIELEGEGVMDANVDGELRVLGDTKDTVKLLSDFDGNVGHWEFVSNGRFIDQGEGGFGDGFSTGVTFDTYVFISDEGCDEGEILSTAYIDADIDVVLAAPEALVEQGAVGDGDSETSITLSNGSVDYDLTGWDGETAIVTKLGTYGYVTLDTETNELTYHLNDEDADTQALGAGHAVTDSFTIVVQDGDAVITRQVEFTIQGSNDAPEATDNFFEGIPDEVTTGEAFSFTLAAKAFTDVDIEDSLTYEAVQLVDGSYETELPEWLSFDPVTRTFSGEPGVHDFGDYLILVRATDEHGVSASETFTLNVEEPSVPAPVLDLDADDSSGATESDYQTSVTFGTPTAVLDSDATITDAATINSATIALTGEGFNGNTDYPDTVLTIDADLLEGATFNTTDFKWHWNDISWSFSGGSSGMFVYINGTGTAAEYLEVFRAARMSFDDDTSNTSANVTITVEGDGGSDTATTVVDIPNRAPDINVFPFNSANATVDETDVPPQASGTVTVLDNDRDPITFTVTDLDADGPLGAHSVDDFLGFLWVEAPTEPNSNQYTWRFEPDNETFDYLNGGESLILHYTIHASDGSASDDQIINITINGTDETPPNQPPVAESDDLNALVAPDEGWTYNSQNGHYYKFVPGSIDFHAARIAATGLGYLATVTDADENTFVKSLLPVEKIGWIGASDEGAEGIFTWRTGPEMGQAIPGGFWREGEPNNNNNDDPENYVYIRADGWADYNLDADGYIVEENTFTEDSSVTFDVSLLFANDSDPDSSGPLSIDALSETSSLGAQITFLDGSITYDPSTVAAFQALKGGEIATDTFTYTIFDGLDSSTEATVTVKVTGINDASRVDLNGADEGTGYEATHNGVSQAAVSLFGPELDISDVDSANIQSATIIASVQQYDNISNGGLPAGLIESRETLPDQRIQITVTGLASLAVYEQVLAGYTFQTSDDSLADRQIALVVQDADGATSNTVTTIVHAPSPPPPPNEAPVISIDDFVGEPTRDDGGSEIAVDIDASSSSTIVTLSDGSFVVVWNDLYSAHQRLHAQHFASNGTPLNEPFWIAGESESGEHVLDSSGGNVAVLPNDRMFVTYRDAASGDVYGRFFNTSEPDGGAIAIATGAAEQSQAKVVALPNGSLFTFWTVISGQEANIFGRIIQSDGIPVGDAFVIDDSVGYAAEPSAVQMLDGTVLVVWKSTTPTDSEEVFGRRFDANGSSPDSAPYVLNTTHDGIQALVTVTRLTDGRIVATWTSDGNEQDQDGYGVFGRIFGSDGYTPLSDEFQVNAEPGDNQLRSTVTALNDGGFVVTWENDPDGDGNEVAMQRFGFDGEGNPVKIGDETVVATNGLAPDVAGLYDGAFAVTWLQYNTEGQVLGVKARVYDGSSIVTGIEISDPDAGESELTVTVTAAHGTITAADDEVVDGAPEDAATLSFTGTLSEINGILDSGIIYTPDGSSADQAITLTVNDGNGGTDITNFIFNDYAPNGATLEGTDEKDVIFTTGQSDTITGGLKADTFVFDEDLIGNDIITDFNVNEDRMVFTSTEFSCFEDLQLADAITYADGTATINLGEDGTVTLNNVADNSLQASNFVFHPF